MNMDIVTTDPPPPSRVTERLVRWLLAPIAPHRVKQLDGHSHLEAHDVIAHLTRMFGPLGWSATVVESALLNQWSEDRETRSSRTARQKDKTLQPQMYTAWTAVYRATVRLTIHRQGHADEVWASYEDVATGDGQAQVTCGDAHDLALKSAVSTATKRAARCLGDQFGLSLYDDGRQSALVRFTITGPGAEERVPAELTPGMGPDDGGPL